MAQKKQKISISLPLELLVFVDSAAKRENLSRSSYLVRLLKEKAAEREHKLMVEGYKAMAEENRKLAEESLAAVMEAWS